MSGEPVGFCFLLQVETRISKWVSEGQAAKPARKKSLAARNDS